MILWALTLFSLIGNYLNCKKISACFLVWVLVNLGWLVVDIKTGAVSRATLDIIQIGFSIYGFKEWKKDGLIKEEKTCNFNGYKVF